MPRARCLQTLVHFRKRVVNPYERLNFTGSRTLCRVLLDRIGDIPADSKSLGTRMLRDFLHYAETGKIAAGQVTQGEFDSPFEEAVAMALRIQGYKVEPQVGVSGFKIDLGVLHPDKPGRFVLGIECDGATYHSSRSARDRDRLRQQVLEGLGWQLYRIWSTDWFRRPVKEAERLINAVEQALESSSDQRTESLTTIPLKIAPEPTKTLGVQVNGFRDFVPRQKATQPTPPLSSDEAIEALAVPYEEYKMRSFPGRELNDLTERELVDIVVSIVQCETPIQLEE
jgi:very-short-patch-repair endonuclease